MLEISKELKDEINSKAEAFANKYLNGKVNTHEFAIIEDTYSACATEYATKLLQEQKVLEAYKKDHKINSDLLETAIDILERVASRHETGLLPDTFIYNEIKTFLDGTEK